MSRYFLFTRWRDFLYNEIYKIILKVVIVPKIRSLKKKIFYGFKT